MSNIVIILEKNYEHDDYYNFIVRDAGILTKGKITIKNAEEIYITLAKDFGGNKSGNE